MKKCTQVLCLLLALLPLAVRSQSNGWISLFNGKSLEGWQVGENASSFSVENGTIKVAGPRAHLFYVGPVGEHSFKNFEFKAQVMTTPGSNSGIYFHTQYQPDGWPSYGYEVQVNNSHTDWRRTGSLYAVDDVKEVYVKDNEWYTEHIIVRGKHVTIKINDKTVVDFTEPDAVGSSDAKRKISRGTFALQGHDPKSVVYFKDIYVKPLAD
ncbi:DUF1080 domain-containing protein [Rhabdobacter roseus]|uniref:3-keto-alpha-glucoside-1,2-lyase/3-keto-2-hydroxy-glucal hydratase domain-containing protein n=1 Tax=Rhabdobacter roseus TaxID=1655419 RepID=A0A840TL97_9BACT|nr:DUF1080 domain-containing protein [Rhabdobacter roseus]MBB5283715.1 hypothetical protein [Rhabdobacter roseus]